MTCGNASRSAIRCAVRRLGVCTGQEPLGVVGRQRLTKNRQPAHASARNPQGRSISAHPRADIHAAKGPRASPAQRAIRLETHRTTRAGTATNHPDGRSTPQTPAHDQQKHPRTLTHQPPEQPFQGGGSPLAYPPPLQRGLHQNVPKLLPVTPQRLHSMAVGTQGDHVVDVVGTVSGQILDVVHLKYRVASRGERLEARIWTVRVLAEPATPFQDRRADAP